MLDQGIVNEELSYSFFSKETLVFNSVIAEEKSSESLTMTCPAIKLTDSNYLRDLNQIVEFIPTDCIPLHFLNRYLEDFCAEKIKDKEHSMIKSVMAYTMTDLKCLDRTFSEESILFKEIKATLINKTGNFHGFTAKRVVQAGNEEEVIVVEYK
jgi:hypothetical protein